MQTADSAPPSSSEPINQPELTGRRILKFYWPLAISWLFMSIEGPATTAAISRRPDGVLNTAAMLIMFSLALWIESPIIDLLTTSTTLAKNRQSYRTITTFVGYLLLLVTAAHALLAFTPIYWVLTESIIGVRHDIAVAARPGLMIMLPWSAFIGWRRYLQGILIRHSETRWVGLGTVVRMTAMGGTAIGLYLFTAVPGLPLAACALIAGVGAEAGFAHWASRRVIHREYAVDTPDNGEEALTYRKLAKFHFPLTLTTMVMFLGMPMLTAALSRMGDPVISLAAFQVSATMLWLLRCFAYALPEVVITLHHDDQSAVKLRRFSMQVGLASSGLVALVWVLSIDRFYFQSVLHTPLEVSRVAHFAFLSGVLLPIITALQCYVRGMLAAHHLTVSRLVAAGVEILALGVFLQIAVLTHTSGVVGVNIALTCSLAIELGVLAYAWHHGSVDAVRA